MITALARKIFGSPNDRRLKTTRSLVEAVNALEAETRALSDADLRSRTDHFRMQVALGTKIDALLVPAFAVVREAARRVLGQRHYDVQLIGGAVLHQGAIAEMRTGEGKTLVSTLAAYLNALEGKGVHVVTVNEYLARRDAETMGKVFAFLGMSTGVVHADIDDATRRAAYACDVTYGTNSEFGFDYLRDNMRMTKAEQVQRGHHYAIVDEVDSILIDEARTPLIISGPAEDRSNLYRAIDSLMGSLRPEHYARDEKQKSVTFTDAGSQHFEDLLKDGLGDDGLYGARNSVILHALLQALRAHAAYVRDKDYLVRDGEVMIIDPFTGRVLPGRRFADGLHQALEAKEGVAILAETRTMASTTYQNYFRLYAKLSGMTGTALSEADEFRHIYGLEVVEIPTNRPIARMDEDDAIYRTAAEKNRAIVAEIERAHARLQPVLVGTSSVEQSEHIAALLEAAGFTRLDFDDAEALKAAYVDAREGRPGRRFAVLNAKLHGKEAEIVAEAGVPGAVTIATNMAGRGTDIKLGGSLDIRMEREFADLAEGDARDAVVLAIESEIEANRQRVLEAGAIEEGSSFPGGLYVIGTERHESRRIDNQLMGRAGRQGDPGRSRFYLSLEDDLVRVFGPAAIARVLDSVGIEEGEAIVHPIVNKAVAKAQKRVENQNYEARKDVLKFDDVINHQRKSVFAQRDEIMTSESVRESIHDMRSDTVDRIVRRFVTEGYNSDWDIDGLAAEIKRVLRLELPLAEWAEEASMDDAEMLRRIHAKADEAYEAVLAENGADAMLFVERSILLQLLDRQWQIHLGLIDALREAVVWRAVAQRDPVMEFKADAFDLFERMSSELSEEVTRHVLHVYVPKPDEATAA